MIYKLKKSAKERGWIYDPEYDEVPANESAPIGMVAMAACQILQIKGGVTMRIAGPSPRYCTRELVFLEFLPPRSEHQAISGLEFIDLVSRLEERLEATETARSGAREG